MPHKGSAKALLAKIPKVDLVLKHPSVQGLAGKVPLLVLKEAVRSSVDFLRNKVLAGEIADEGPLSVAAAAEASALLAQAMAQPRLRPVINATGVVVHTNLGRSPLPEEAIEQVIMAAVGYSNLEFDLGSGERGSRDELVEGLLRDLTGSEAATVVNNGAAAVLLVLDTLAGGQEVVVSRGELVEIGGSFRIPEVMAKSGARLVEVGTTNRTRLSDYRQALGEGTALLMKVHPSNYRIVGFAEEASIGELADLARETGLPLYVDLGSGCLVDLSAHGITHEPTAGEVLRAGADLVSFSGDKLLGGPQAGIVLGRADLVRRLRKNPLKRALRPGKLTLAALEAVLRVYLEPGRAFEVLPALRMMATTREEVARRARRFARRLHGLPVTVSFVPGFSRVGGGALPQQELPTVLLALSAEDLSAQDLEGRLREAEVPVVGRIVEDRLCLDLRTVPDEDLPQLESALRAALEG